MGYAVNSWEQTLIFGCVILIRIPVINNEIQYTQTVTKGKQTCSTNVYKNLGIIGFLVPD